jgi:hypothetical protein
MAVVPTICGALWLKLRRAAWGGRLRQRHELTHEQEEIQVIQAVAMLLEQQLEGALRRQ